MLEEADDILLIDQLATLGINAGDIKKAKEAGYCTVKSLLMVPKKELWAIKGLSEAKVDKVLDAARKLCEIGFMTGNQFLEARKRVLKITTGVQDEGDLACTSGRWEAEPPISILANRMINVINIALSSSSRVTSHLPSRSAPGV